MEIQEMITVINALGDDALMSLVIISLVDFAEVLLMLGLVSWAVRVAWKAFKKYECWDDKYFENSKEETK